MYPNERICSPYQHLQIDKYYVEYNLEINTHADYKISKINEMNLLHPNVFKLFKNIVHIGIRVDCRDRLKEYEFDLLSFLSVIIGSEKRNITYQIFLKPRKGIDSWLIHCITASVLSSYKDKGWNIRYQKTTNKYDNIFIEPLE